MIYDIAMALRPVQPIRVAYAETQQWLLSLCHQLKTKAQLKNTHIHTEAQLKHFA